MLQYTTRPISDRSPFGRFPAQNSPFRVGWSQALDLLESEFDAIGGTDLVIECDVREQDIRNDGMIRANARPSSRAVRVALDSDRGRLVFACDRYETSSWQKMDSWQANIYAIAKTMEALRAVERYGAAESHEQYAGYRQIAAPKQKGFQSPVEARAWLESFLGHQGSIPNLLREAKRRTHPDLVGTDDVDNWLMVQEAERWLTQ